jgi:hypothetical protein
MPGRKPHSRSGETLARFLEGGAEFGEREFAYNSCGQRVAQIEAVGAFIAEAGTIANGFGALAYRGLHIVTGWHGDFPFFVGVSS